MLKALKMNINKINYYRNIADYSCQHIMYVDSYTLCTFTENKTIRRCRQINQ